jgi:gliding motility-associated-like protein
MKIFGRLKQSVHCTLFILLSIPALSQSSGCPANIDFEFGTFQNWQCYTGSVALTGGMNVVSVTPSSPVSNRHTILGPSSAGVLDPYGNFPVLCPNGSAYSIKLGNTGTNREAERVSYAFTIPAGQNEFSLVYQYAVVFQDPAHTAQEQPRFTAKVYDETANSYVSCASYNYIATSNLPGFVRSPVISNVWYKPWTPCTINLSGLAGHTIRLEFTTADCTQGAHFGYAYVDVNVGCTSPVSGASYCPGTNSVTLNAPFGYQNYYWYNNNMSELLGTQQTLTIAPAPPINTTVALDMVPFAGFGCRDTVYATLTPGVAPLANAGDDRQMCSGAQVMIGSAPLSGYSYHWSPAAGLSDTAMANPMATPAVTTDYIVTVTDVVSGCTKQDTVTVHVTPPLNPVFTVSTATGQCINNNNFQFVNANTSYSYQWRFGDGSTTTQQSPAHQYAQAGTYPVTLVATTMNGCTDSTTQNMMVYDLPSGNITSPGTMICEGSPVVLTASGGVNYNWFRNGNVVHQNAADTMHALQAGTYSAEIVDQHGCRKMAGNTIALDFTKKPSAAFNYDKYCVDFPTVFNNNSTVAGSLPVSYSWDFGNGNNSSQKDPAYKFLQAGDYDVSLSVTPLSCPQLVSVVHKKIAIKKAIEGVNYVPVNAVVNKAVELKAREIGVAYLWSPNQNLNTTASFHPSFTGSAEEMYHIRITNPSGCITIDSQLVRIFQEREIYLPKAFTPNGDGQNDRMYPFLVGIKELKIFRIMNRWGVVVYESKSDLPGWDGTYKGQPQPMDGYVWEALAVDQDGKTVTRNGSFTLIR